MKGCPKIPNVFVPKSPRHISADKNQVNSVSLLRSKIFIKCTHLGPYRGCDSMDCTVVSLSWKFPYGRGLLSVLPNALSVKSEFRFCLKHNNVFVLRSFIKNNSLSSSLSMLVPQFSRQTAILYLLLVYAVNILCVVRIEVGFSTVTTLNFILLEFCCCMILNIKFSL